MRKSLSSKCVSALLILAALAPWSVLPLFPEDAFAQTSVTTPTGSPLSNQAARQGGTASFSQAAASGAVSIGACLAAGGISLGGGIASVLGSLGLSGGASAAASAVGLGGGAASTGATAAGAAGAALAVPVVDIPAGVQLALLNATAIKIAGIQTAQLVQISAMQNKESVLDCVAWALAKMIWRSVAASIIDWINSGFNGSPAFVQDFGRFFRNIGDEAIGEIIQGDQYLAFLCSPFQLNIRIALAMRYARRAPTCTLSKVIDNVENFAKSFQGGGGWPAWLQYFVVPNNNPYGGYIVSEATVGFYYQNKLGQQQYEQSLTRGFLNQKEKVCSQYPKQGGGTQEICREITVTPGELIAQKAGQVIGGGETQLLLADEFNEIIDALVAQLLGKALNSLFSLSQPPAYEDSLYSNGYSFTNELSGAAPNTVAPTYGGSFVGDDGSVIRQIDEAISQEQSYQALNRQGISSVERTEGQVAQVAQCWSSKAAGTSTPPVTDPGDRNQAGIQARTLGLTAQALAQRKAPYVAEIEQSERNIAELTSLLERASAATSQAELDVVLRDFNGTRSLGEYAQPNDFIRVSSTVAILDSELGLYETQLPSEYTRCQYFPMDPPTN